MKKCIAIIIAILLITQVVVAETVAEKPRELDNVRYFWIKIKQPFGKFIALFTGKSDETRLRYISEKQALLEDITLMEDKEDLVNEVLADTEDAYEKTDDPLVQSGLKVVEEEMNSVLEDIKNESDIEGFFTNLKEVLSEREMNPSYMELAKDIFDSDIVVFLPQEEVYTLKFSEGKYLGYAEGAQKDAEYSMHLSYSQLNALSKALERREYNEADSILANALPKKLSVKIKDRVQKRYSEHIQNAVQND